MAVLLEELLRVEVLPRCVTAAHEEKMVDHKSRGIGSGKNSVDDHCEWDTEMFY